MGCAASVSTQNKLADADEISMKQPPPPIRQRSDPQLSGAKRRLTLSATSSSGMLRRRRSSNGGDLSSGRLYSFFGGRNSAGNRRTSEVADVQADPLDLGTDSHVISAPSEWVVFLGQRSSGKSTVIRQIKALYDPIDPEDTIKYVREVHKYVLALFKKVVPLPSSPTAAWKSDEHCAAAERLHALKRRATVSAEVADDLELLWDDPIVRRSIDRLSNPQAKKATRHFGTRLRELASETFVPETLDLVHLALPTAGQQGTRVYGSSVQQLCLYESNEELQPSSSFQGRESARQVRAPRAASGAHPRDPVARWRHPLLTDTYAHAIARSVQYPRSRAACCRVCRSRNLAGRSAAAGRQCASAVAREFPG